MDTQEEILSRLKFIGHLEREEKIDSRKVSKQPNTIYTRFLRTFIYPDNRSNSVRFIKDVITRTIEIIDLHKGNPVICKPIIIDLVKSKQGITNLRYTYSDDVKMQCDLDIIIGTITSKLSGLREKYPHLFETT